MEKLFGKFGLRETLKLLIPGFYFVSLMFPLKSTINIEVLDSSVANSVLFIIFTLLYGLMLYWIDIPKRMPFFKNNLPTTKLKKKYSNINEKLVINTYFSFYDSLPKSQLDKTDLYTSLYHFCINMSVSSLIIAFVYYVTGTYEIQVLGYGHIALFVFVISIISALGLFFGKRKIKYMFERQFEGFLSSEYLSTLTKEK